MNAPAATLLAPADSALAVGDVYSASLVATLPIVAAVVAFAFLRHSSAGTRAIMWRCALVGLLAIYAGRFMPWQWMAWVLPELLARPLVALGTVQLDVPPGVAGSGEVSSVVTPVRALLVLYWGGVLLVLVRTLVARVRLVGVGRRAVTLAEPRWRMRLRRAGEATGIPTETVRLLASANVPVPVTWGVRRPVILLPNAALVWPADRLQAVLRHELAHVRARDAAMRLAARVACALFWFHPGAWWLARRLEADAEEACDNRVLLSGVRASDYAEWLAASARGADRELQGAMALARRGNLRARLAAVTDTSRRIVVPGRRAVLCAVALSVAVVAPLATARLAPTRDVLTSLMLETRWESRAWAVVRLAQRADSVEVARTAARHDPDPAVRAWARYALGLNALNQAPRSRS
jgi:beta-lactamase regulating signal transducer with metallopeptidase domain